MAKLNIRKDDFTKQEIGKALSILFSMTDDVHVKDFTNLPKRTQEKLYYSYMEMARNHAAVKERVDELEKLETQYKKQEAYIHKQKQNIAKLKCEIRQLKKSKRA